MRGKLKVLLSFSQNSIIQKLYQISPGQVIAWVCPLILFHFVSHSSLFFFLFPLLFLDHRNFPSIVASSRTTIFLLVGELSSKALKAVSSEENEHTKKLWNLITRLSDFFSIFTIYYLWIHDIVSSLTHLYTISACNKFRQDMNTFFIKINLFWAQTLIFYVCRKMYYEKS